MKYSVTAKTLHTLHISVWILRKFRNIEGTIELRIVTWPKVSHFDVPHPLTCVTFWRKNSTKFGMKIIKNFRQEVHIKISLNHYRPFHFWKLKFSGLSANILSEIRIFSSKYLKMKGSTSSYLHTIYDSYNIWYAKYIS